MATESTTKTKNGVPRKERPKLALDPSQPPTTQGKPRARVFLACAQCRKRKIRCDGAKPACYNCTQRSASGATECTYDSAPRRRGPDRLPGARSRRGVGDPPVKRRRRRSDHEYDHNEPDFELDEEYIVQGNDLARGELVEVATGDCVLEAYASSINTNSLSPVSATGNNNAHSLPGHTSMQGQPYAALQHGTESGGLVIDTSAYTQTSYAREPESAVSVSSTFVHEPISAVYASAGPAAHAYVPHASSVASGSRSQGNPGRYAQETFPHDQRPPSDTASVMPASHTQKFAPEGYVVPSQGYTHIPDAHHIGQAVEYAGSVTSVTGTDFAGSTTLSGYAGRRVRHAGDDVLESAGPGLGFPAYSTTATRRYSVDSSTHTSFGSPEFAGPSFHSSIAAYANDPKMDNAGFVLASTLAQAPAYEYQYPSPPGTAQSQGHVQSPTTTQPLYQHYAQAQALQEPHHVPLAHFEHVHARQRSTSTSSFAGTSYAIPASFYEEAEEIYGGHEDSVASVGAEPSFDFTRQTWWDSLLALYASSQVPLALNLGSATPHGQLGFGGRRAARAAVRADVKFLFAVAPHWLFFLHVPTFYAALAAPERACPALVLAVCAISALFQSSEAGDGAEGRRRALKLRDVAEGALDAALNSRSISEDLAGAAWILAFFEQCCHPAHKHGRVRSALHKLDGLTQFLRLSALDAGDPTASGYARGEVPVVGTGVEGLPSNTTSGRTGPPSISNQHQHQGPALHEHLFPQRSRQSSSSQSPTQLMQVHGQSLGQRGCSCDERTLGHVDPGAAQHTPFWVTSPAWQNTWSHAEIRREGSRRLAWSAMTLAAAYSSYAAATGYGVPELSLLEPGNFNLLFPGEALGTGKRSVWALYLRAMLLWLACLRMRARVDSMRRPSMPNGSSSTAGRGVYDGGHSGGVPDSEISAFAMKAWHETESIERALNMHTCSVEPAMLYHGREYLFNTRMCISFEFRRFIPHVTGVGREKSEEWLRDQGRRAKMAAHSLQAVSGSRGHTLAHRPHFVWWFMGQVRRALQLWSLDNSLTIALDVCRDFMMPIAHLTELFPCAEQRIKFEELQVALQNATAQASQSGYVVRTS